MSQTFAQQSYFHSIDHSMSRNICVFVSYFMFYISFSFYCFLFFDWFLYTTKKVCFGRGRSEFFIKRAEFEVF